MRVRSIRSKVLIAIIGITLFTALAIAAVFYQRSSQMIEQNYITRQQQRLRILMDNIDDTLKNVCNTNIKAACDSKIKKKLKKYLRDGDEKKLTELSERMRIFSGENSLITSMYLVIPEKKLVVTTLDYPVYKGKISKKKLEKLQEKIEADSGPVIADDILHEGSLLFVFTETVENEQGEVLAYLCANIEESKLSYGYFKNPETEEMDGIYLLKGGRIAASEELSTMGTTFDKNGNYTKWISGSNVAGTDRENIYIYCEGFFSGCGIFTKVKRSVVLSDLQQMKTYIAGIVLLVLLAAFAAATYLTHLVYRPVKKLTTAMKQISAGEIHIRAEVVSQDEIGMASEEFNRMLDRIEELIEELVAQEKKKKDAELEALQYQITPHFMYNTLNSIKYYALLHQEREIAGVIEDFVELLQTCIRKKGAFLTVAEEVQVLQDYIHLQEFRNGQSYQTEYQIEDQAQQCLIPRLILQPLIENSILHGIDIKKKQGELVIRAWIAEERLYLEVRDNGRGMSQDKIRELLCQTEKKTKGLTAVGIPNIIERLHLYYGTRAALKYESSGEGTTATIYLPVKRNGEGT